jgi:hypothetical protein
MNPSRLFSIAAAISLFWLLVLGNPTALVATLFNLGCARACSKLAA